MRTDPFTNIFDSGGLQVTNWFNNQGLKYAANNAFGCVVALTFDLEDRITNRINADRIAVGFAYDNLGRVTSRAYPDTNSESFGYTNGLLVFYTNQLQQVTSFGYDAARRKTRETNANSEITSFSYDSADDLLTLTDGKSQITTWNYDLYGRPTNKVDAAGNTNFAYQYDADNRPTNRWTPVSSTAYTYDPVGELTKVVYPAPFAATNAYAFDALGRLTNMTDLTGNTAYSYDPLGELLSENGPWTDDAVNYTYVNRFRSSLAIQQPNANAWMQYYGYDSAWRMTNTTSPAGGFGYRYDGLRQTRVGTLELPGGALITNKFDLMARLLSTTMENSYGTAVNSHAYTYDGAGRRISQTRFDGSYVDYSYDEIGQLIQAQGYEENHTNRLNETLGYGYDMAHNLNLRTNNALIETFTVNSLNELSGATHSGTLTVEGTSGVLATNVTVNGLSVGAAGLYQDGTFAKGGFTVTNGNNSFTAIATDALGRHSTNTVTAYLPASVGYTYDLNGNVLSDGTRNFAYDGENQLVTVYVTNLWQSQFVYDGRSRRRITRELTWQGGIWVQTNEVHYIYDGNVVVQERDINNVPLTTYTRGKDLSGSLQGAGGIGGMLAFTQPSTVNPQHYYYHADGNGNITAILNGNMLVAKYLYDPYGNVLSLSGPMAAANLYRFSSKEWHPNSGLVYYLHRYFDPSLQRWPNRDPIQELGGLNLYGYVDNNPVNRSDPLGLLGGFVGGGGSFGGGGAGGSWDPTPNSPPSAPNSPPDAPPTSPVGAGSHAPTCAAATAGGAVAGPQLWSAGLNGGDQSVFWSGYNQGARDIAESLGGTTLEQTPIGGTLDFLSNTVGVPGLGPIWDAASATFAGNATSATAVILAPGVTWTTIELPILLENAVPILFFP